MQIFPNTSQIMNYYSIFSNSAVMDPEWGIRGLHPPPQIEQKKCNETRQIKKEKQLNNLNMWLFLCFNMFVTWKKKT